MELTESLHQDKNTKVKIISTSNVECRGDFSDFVVDKLPLLDRKSSIPDNSFLMLLKLLKKIDIKRVTCAGFDGYSAKDDNYFTGFRNDLYELRHMMSFYREQVMQYCENYFKTLSL